MANKEHEPEEIVSKLRQVVVGQGIARLDAAREVSAIKRSFPIPSERPKPDILLELE